MYANPVPRLIRTNGILPIGPEKTFLVCGVQRGGTSMIAAVIRALGVDMGPAGINHEDAAMLRWLAGDIRDYVARRNGEAQIWGFKLPHAALDLEKFTAPLRSPIVVMVFRNIVSVLDSFMVRGDLSFSAGLERISNYYDAMTRFAAKATMPTLLVSYERAAAAPEKFVDALLAASGLSGISAERRSEAVLSVTGDGGGYTPLPALWYHIDVIRTEKFPADAQISTVINRPFHHITFIGEIDVSSILRVNIDVRIDEEKNTFPYWLDLVVDFGRGFDMLNTHHLLIPDAKATIEFRHEGAVARVAIGATHELAGQFSSVKYRDAGQGDAELTPELAELPVPS